MVDAFCDRGTIEFVRRQARAAKYVTSVCTGAIILGVAGLLKGRRATTHWAFVDLLPLVGATHEKARVVQDGNVTTAAGVSSGIDFAFTVAAEIAGETAAQSIQLGIEYDPAPPFNSGSPDRAWAAIKSAVLAEGSTSPCRRTAQASTRLSGNDGARQIPWFRCPLLRRYTIVEYCPADDRSTKEEDRCHSTEA